MLKQCISTNYTLSSERCLIHLLTRKQEEENEAPGQSASEEYSDGGDPGVLVDGVQALELVVGDRVSDEEVALQHGPEHAGVPGHGLLGRIYGQESSLNQKTIVNCRISL